MEANEAVRAEVDRKLPALYKLVSIKSLPTPVDASSASNSVAAHRYGRMQAANGGPLAAAGQFNPGASAPALAVLEEFAKDLTDGKLDGFGLDGKPVSTSPVASYDSIRFPVAINHGANEQASRFSAAALFAQADPLVEVGLSTAFEVNNEFCDLVADKVALTKTTEVVVHREMRVDASDVLSCSNARVAQPTRRFGTARQSVNSGRQGFIVRNDGSVESWGQRHCGMLGNGTNASGVERDPVRVTGLANISSIAVSRFAAAARDNAGEVYTWGTNTSGMLGQDSTGTNAECELDNQLVPVRTTPLRVASLPDSIIVEVFERTMYAVAKDGSLRGWGNGQDGELGNGAVIPGGPFAGTDSDVPVLIPGLSQVRALASTNDVTAAMRSDGAVLAWGLNGRGTFGDGTTTPKPRPVPVLGPGGAALTGVKELVGDGVNAFYALMADGSVVRWGVVDGNQQRAAVISGLPEIRHLSRAGQAVILQATNGSVLQFDSATATPRDSTKDYLP